MHPDHLLPITFSSQSRGTSGLEVCKFATNLGHVMPEVYTGEHIRRVCAIAQAQTSLSIDLLEILIFQLSNSFLGDDGDFNFERIVHLMGAFGLDNPTMIRSLFDAAADQPTILAVLDKLWIAAYVTSSTKLVSLIFTEFVRRYDGSDEFALDIYQALHWAIVTENLNLAKVVLSGPKTTHVTEVLSVLGNHYLEKCSMKRNHEFALEMAALLLERYDLLLKTTNESTSNQRRRRRSIRDDTDVVSHALSSGNIRLARFLVGAGFEIRYHSDLWIIPKAGYAKKYLGGYKSRSIIDHQTIFTAAVVPHILLDHSSSIDFSDVGPSIKLSNRAESEKMVLENFLGLSEMLSEIGKLPEWLEGASNSTQSPDLDVVVLAALYGYDAFLQTFMHSPGSLNQQNSEGIWPLSAAALGDNASTCRLLVQLGADPNYVPPCEDWPIPLHNAVFHNSTHLVEVLLGLGTDINRPSKIRHKDPSCFAGPDEHTCTRSALALAIGLHHWETAFLLVHREAEIDSLAFDLAIQSGNSTLIDLLLSNRMSKCLLGQRMIERDDDSLLQTVLENYNTTNGDCSLMLQTRQIKQDILSTAASSGNLNLVSRVLKMKTFGSDHRSLQHALACSLERDFQEISRELIQAGARLSQYDLALSFASCTLAGIREFIASSHDSLLSSAERGLQGLIVELALLDNTLDVVQFALETFPQAYSSGALSAAVLRGAESGFRDSREPMNELLLRRSGTDSEQLDPILENTAVAIAIISQAPAKVFESLLQRSWPEIPAICYYGGIREPFNIAHCHKGLRKVFLARKDLQTVSYVENFHYDDKKLIWHTKSEHGEKPILPLSLAINMRNDQVCAKLMAKGFLADPRTIEAAIREHLSLDVLERVLSGCKEGHEIIRIWDDILHVALDCKNEQAMCHLIQNGANIRARESPTSDMVSFRNLGLRPTVLQRAVRGVRSTDDRRFVQLLLDAGADVNEAPAYADLTALQAAAHNGQLDLARQLVNLGADINARRAVWDGLTCLEAAAQEGRLDMTQFLLNAGATTTGKGQLQYIRAVKLAKDRGHAAVAQILRKHRSWGELDEYLFQDQRLTYAKYVLHPIEYSAEEIRHQADELGRSDVFAFENIWPKIDPAEKDETDSVTSISRTHGSVEANGPAHMPDDLVVTSTSQLAMDVLDNELPSSYGSEIDPFSSQTLASNSTSDYSSRCILRSLSSKRIRISMNEFSR